MQGRCTNTLVTQIHQFLPSLPSHQVDNMDYTPQPCTSLQRAAYEAMFNAISCGCFRDRKIKGEYAVFVMECSASMAFIPHHKTCCFRSNSIVEIGPSHLVETAYSQSVMLSPHLRRHIPIPSLLNPPTCSRSNISTYSILSHA